MSVDLNLLTTFAWYAQANMLLIISGKNYTIKINKGKEW